MKRLDALKDISSIEFFKNLNKLHEVLDDEFIKQFKRSLPFGDTLFDRWERAKKLGFGKDTSIYDSSLVFGNVKVGINCWIGPYTIIDGSGDLEIGDYCTISAGVQIYSHDNIKQTLSSGKAPIERQKVKIGSNVYIGPNSIITKGVQIGCNCIIGAYSLVNKNVSDNSIVFGQPAKLKGKVIVEKGEVRFDYNQ
ncbi:MAG: acyltransferase [Candidatus Methanofastidiosa archaeon]|nr:acyltransferase [Candidatus Methanofastidiosa archaeon]